MASKEAERQALDDLQLLYNDFPEGLIEPGEEPDFRIGGRVGVEVTEYFRPEPWRGETTPQAQESLQRRVVHAAEKLWTENGYPPLVVNVIFDHDSMFEKRNISSVAAELVKFAANSVATGLPVFGEDLPKGVARLTVYPYKHLAWLVSGAVWPPDVDESELRRIITKKEARLPQYRKACSENWLLIFVSAGRRSSLSQLPESFGEIQTSFERVLLLFERRRVIRIA